MGQCPDLGRTRLGCESRRADQSGHPLGHLGEALVDPVVHGLRLVGPILLQLAGLDPSQNFYTLVYRTNRVDVESALSDRVDHFFVQHQVLGVALGDDDSLVSLEAFDLACLIEALDLLVDPAYRLDVAVLFDRPSYSMVLLDWKLSQGGENRVQFCS